MHVYLCIGSTTGGRRRRGGSGRGGGAHIVDFLRQRRAHRRQRAQQVGLEDLRVAAGAQVHLRAVEPPKNSKRKHCLLILVQRREHTRAETALARRCVRVRVTHLGWKNANTSKTECGTAATHVMVLAQLYCKEAKQTSVRKRNSRTSVALPLTFIRPHGNAHSWHTYTTASTHQ